MSDTTQATVKTFNSVFAMGVGIVALATGAVCSVLYLAAGRIENGLATRALQSNGYDITIIEARGLGGAVRFNNIEAINEVLVGAMQLAEGNLVSAAVFGVEGQTLAATEDSFSTSIDASVTAALNENLAQRSNNGLTFAVPVRATPEGPAVGVFVTEWTTQHLLASIEEGRHQKLLLVAAVFLSALVVAGAIFRRFISKPLSLLASRTVSLADGDLESDVPGLHRKDEVGAAARSLETLRSRLSEAHEARREARFQNAAFDTTSAALMIADVEFIVKDFNPAFRSLVGKISDGFAAHGSSINLDDLIGREVAAIHPELHNILQHLDLTSSSDRPSLCIGPYTVTTDIAPVIGENVEHEGYLIEWKGKTQDLANKSIIDAIDANQVRASFSASGEMTSSNEVLGQIFPGIEDEKHLSLTGLVREISETVKDLLQTDKTDFGKFTFSHGGVERIFSGHFSPLVSSDGKPSGLVFIGSDVTENENDLAVSRAETDAAKRAQDEVVGALTSVLNKLAEGDLSCRLSDEFSGDYECLREHFNISVSGLDSALTAVLDNAGSILSESGNISDAAGDLSRRTEQQAATLEHFAAALAQITASVSSAADGANKAHHVVNAARENAEASGSVVREAVEAMGEISSSSEQIERIIGVIDDIAFQTNLLALNAGVEAARAGDAGRGFAVVAPEVRALAQRSSDAAREINTLISTSGNHVKRGVSLVDKAGQALTEIVESVSGIAMHVATIATSAKQQSAGLDEINIAISQLDQVTQQNVAMFEETTAATHTLNSEANALVLATQKFKTSSDRSTDHNSNSPPREMTQRFDTSRVGSQQKASHVPAIEGNVALAIEDDWDDF